MLTSPHEPDKFLATVRKAGFAPMPEDADGGVVVPAALAPATPRMRPPPVRRRVPAAELAARLLAGAPSAHSDTHRELEALASRLDDAEVALLADALDHGRDIRITYRSKAGNRTVRDIRPQELRSMAALVVSPTSRGAGVHRQRHRDRRPGRLTSSTTA